MPRQLKFTKEERIARTIGIILIFLLATELFYMFIYE